MVKALMLNLMALGLLPRFGLVKYQGVCAMR